MAWVVMGPVVKGFQMWVEDSDVMLSFHDYEKEGLSRAYKSWSGFEYLYDLLKKREEEQL